MLLSVVVALILTPGPVRLAAQAGGEGARGRRDRLRPVPAVLPLVRPGVPARPETVRELWSGHVIAKKLRYLVVFVLLVAALGCLFQRMPTGLPPRRGPGHPVRAGDAAGRFDAGADRAASWSRCAATSWRTKRRRWRPASRWRAGAFRGRGQNVGMLFVKLKDWELRQPAGAESRRAAEARHARSSRKMRNARVFAFPPPAVIELGQSRPASTSCCRTAAALGHEALMAARNQLLGHGGAGPAADPGAAQRHGGRAAVQGRRRLGEGGRARRPDRLDPHDHLGRVRQRLRRTTSSRAGGSSGSTPRPTPRSGCSPRTSTGSTSATIAGR